MGRREYYLRSWMISSSCPLDFLPSILIYNVHKIRYDRHIKETQINMSSMPLFVAHQHTFSFESFLDNNGKHIFSKSCRDCFFFNIFSTLPILPKIICQKIYSEIWLPLAPPLRSWFDEQNPLFQKRCIGQRAIPVRNYSLSNESNHSSLIFFR